MSATRRANRHALVLALLLLNACTAHAATWTRQTVGNALEPSPSIGIDGSGTPFVVHNTGGSPRLAYQDGGAWVGAILNTPSSKARPSIPGETDLIYYVVPSLEFGFGAGVPCVLYHEAPESNIWFAHPNAAGVWTYERLSEAGDSPSLERDAAGALHAVFRDHLLGPRYGRLDSGGWTFETAPAAGPLAVDFAGRPSIVYAAGESGDAVRWARRETGGWIVEICEAVAATHAALAIDGSGEPHVVFTDHPNQRLRYARRASGVWTVETVASGVGQWFSAAIALGAGGEPFVSFYDPATASFRFATRSSGVWSHEVVQASQSAHGCDIAIDSAGRPHLAYFTGGVTNLVRYATTAEAITDVAPGVATLGFALASAAPNPLRSGGALELALRLDSPRRVTVELFDAAGRRVDGREPLELGAGAQSLRWNPRVAGGGLYFISVRSERGEQRVARLAVMR